jgi:tetratricopeptide (TPR) repeat protein
VFASGSPGGTVASVNFLLGRRLNHLIGADDVALLASTQRILSCAALEGRTFTAEAVAEALGFSRDEVIDLLDDRLAVPRAGTDGLVEELAALHVTDENATRSLWRYRFRSRLDWLTLRHYGLGGATNRHEVIGRLAAALESCYGGETYRVARTLSALLAEVGNRDQARYYRHLYYTTANRQIMMWRAHDATKIPSTADSYDRNRAAEVLLAAARALYHSGPWDEGRIFAEQIVALTDVRLYRALGHFYAGVFYMRCEVASVAEEYLQQALTEFEELHDKQGVADATFELAVLEKVTGNLEGALDGYLRVLALREQLGDRAQQSVVHSGLGDIYLDLNQLRRAREAYRRSFEVADEINDVFHKASALVGMAGLDLEEGHSDRVPAAIREALPILREHDARDQEQGALALLSEAEYQNDNLDAAADASRAALVIQEEIRDPGAMAVTLQRLGYIRWHQEKRDRASAAFCDALEIFDHFEQHALAATVRLALEELEAGKPPPPKTPPESLGAM